MQAHPFVKSIRHRTAGVLFFLFAIAVQCLLHYFYSNENIIAAITDSLVSTLFFAVLCYFLWYAIAFISVPQAELIISIIVIGIWLTGSFAGQYLGEELGDIPHLPFLRTLPFRLLFGLLAWIIFILWYRNIRLSYWKEERIISENMKAMEGKESIDRVVVKDGTRINIIQLNELIYIQANGDYIVLVTANGQYLKEQTMKSIEHQLPSSQFVRIHRSYIANVEQIKRVELYGKETYQVILKNGETIKASSSGYKLLKEKLSL